MYTSLSPGKSAGLLVVVCWRFPWDMSTARSCSDRCNIRLFFVTINYIYNFIIVNTRNTSVCVSSALSLAPSASRCSVFVCYYDVSPILPLAPSLIHQIFSCCCL